MSKAAFQKGQSRNESPSYLDYLLIVAFRLQARSFVDILFGMLRCQSSVLQALFVACPLGTGKKKPNPNGCQSSPKRQGKQKERGKKIGRMR